MSTSSSTTTNEFKFGNKRTRKTTTITSKKVSGDWVEVERTEVIEEWDEPVTYTPQAPPLQPLQVPAYPPYPGYPTLPYVTY